MRSYRLASYPIVRIGMWKETFALKLLVADALGVATQAREHFAIRRCSAGVYEPRDDRQH